jgi:hypothetical protein
LRNLLGKLGFQSRQSVEPKCAAFEHPRSNTLLLLPANKDDEPARLADILSIRTHLIFRGHLDESVFDEFVENEGIRVSS